MASHQVHVSSIRDDMHAPVMRRGHVAWETLAPRVIDSAPLHLNSAPRNFSWYPSKMAQESWRGQRAVNARQGKLCLRHACVAQSCPFLPIFAYSCPNSYNIFPLMVYHLLGTYSQLTMYSGQLSLVSALSWMTLFRTRLGQVHFFLAHVFGFRPLTILLSFGSSLVVPRCFSLGRLPL